MKESSNTAVKTFISSSATDEKKTVNEGLIISKEKGTTSVSSAIKETVSSEPINKEVVEKEIIDKEQISQVMAPCVDISGSGASSSSSISEPEQKGTMHAMNKHGLLAVSDL